ncbi:hydroxyacid dehydrogenase [Planifilum fimeticola]|uniref:hydroxyacid dehydrogenase n=1 Tax=Planifilum fimeticola TaxID=201975 RepID=UPI003183B094
MGNLQIIVSEVIWPEGLKRLREYADVFYDPHLWRRKKELAERLQRADALVVRNQTRVDVALLDEAKHLKVIGRLGVGVDNIDLRAARSRGIAVVYGRNANATSVAEYVMAAILHCSRRLFAADRDVRAGGWDRSRFGGNEIFGKVLGLVGLGEIAHRVAKRAMAFGMRVIGYDPYVTPFDFPVAETGVKRVDFSELLQSADFVSLHVPLNDETRHLFSWSEFRQMKPTAWIINSSRGGVIHEGDLAAALEHGMIGGAVLDVLEKEPVSPEHPLLGHDRVVFTPHIAGLTQEAQVRTSHLVAEEVIRVLSGQPSLYSI